MNTPLLSNDTFVLLRYLALEPKTTNDLARAFNVSPRTIAQRIRQLKIHDLVESTNKLHFVSTNGLNQMSANPPTK